MKLQTRYLVGIVSLHVLSCASPSSPPVATVRGVSASAGATMHVADVRVNFSNVGGPKRLAHAYVAVADDLQAPVAGATVTGDWTGCTTSTGSGITRLVTDADGKVEGLAQIDAHKAISCWGKPRCTWTFTVTDVTHATLTYDPAQDVKSSNGTQCR